MFNWLSFITYTLISSFTPGPDNIMCMTNGQIKGFKKAMPFTFGIFVGFIGVTSLCMVFCNTLTTLIPKIQLPFTVLGALYILYLAVMTFKSSGEIKPEKVRSGFLAGLTLQFINPKVYICTIMSIESYIMPFYKGQSLKLFGFVILISFNALLVTTCWTAFGATFKKMFSKHAKVVNTILALLLVYCAMSLFFNL